MSNSKAIDYLCAHEVTVREVRDNSKSEYDYYVPMHNAVKALYIASGDTALRYETLIREIYSQGHENINDIIDLFKL